MKKHHDIMLRAKLEREAREEEQRRQEHEQLLATISIADQPFLFLADELLLHLFSFLSAADLVVASRVCQRLVPSSSPMCCLH